jgi:hypothetical protein
MNLTRKADSGKSLFGLEFAVALAFAALVATVPLPGNAAPGCDPGAATVAPKPTPPIAITHRLSAPPQVGQPVDVILSIAAEGDMTGVRVNFAAADPLAMIDPVDSLPLGSFRAGEGTDVAVTVLPLLNQTHYLSVTVTALIDGVEQTRSIAIPIRTPGSELRKSDDDAAGKPAERVRSFQAIETVY